MIRPPLSHRPASFEIHPFYVPYVERVVGETLEEALENDSQAWEELLADVTPALERHRYAEGKWSVREVVGHVVDAERMFASRALAFSRGDRGPYPGFDENSYARHSNAHERPLKELASEFRSVRAATSTLAQGLDGDMWDRVGEASGRKFSVRGLLWIVAGHPDHHRRLLKGRYLT